MSDNLGPRRVMDTYGDILQIPNGNNGVDGTLRTVRDGRGDATALSLSNTQGDMPVLATGSTTPRSLAARFSEDVRVRDFGAWGSDPAVNRTTLLAAAAALPFGGRVLIPRGTWPINNLTLADYVWLEGEGGEVSVLMVRQTTGNAITLGVAGGIRGIKITADVTRTSGAFVRWTGNSAGLENCVMDSYYWAVHVGDKTAAITVNPGIKDCVFRSPLVSAGTGGVFFEHVSNGVFSQNLMTGQSGTHPDWALRIDRADTVFISNTNITEHGTGLRCAPTSGHSVLAVQAVNSLFDTPRRNAAASDRNGVELVGLDSGQVKSIQFTNCWFGFSEFAGGAFLSGGSTGLVDGVVFAGCQFMGNAVDGLIAAGPNTNNIIVTGSIASGNGRFGLGFAGAAQRFTVIGNRLGPSGDFGGNAFGVWVENLASNNYMIAHNNANGNTTAAISDSGTGVNKIVANNLA